MQELLNPTYFTPRGFLYTSLIEDIKRLLEQNESNWLIEFSDITSIFIYGENIDGKYSAIEPLIINLYFGNLISQHSHLKKVITNLQKELRRNMKYDLEFKLELQISDQDPKIFLYKYYDLLNDKLIINKEYKKQFTKKTEEPKIYIQVEKEPKIQPKKEIESKGSERIENIKEIENRPKFPTIIAVPKSFEEFNEILKYEGSNIIKYTKENIQETTEKTLNALGLGSSKEIKGNKNNQ